LRFTVPMSFVWSCPEIGGEHHAGNNREYAL